MVKNKVQKIVLMLSLILIITLFLVTAVFANSENTASENTACFLHPDSEYYCQEIEENLAKEECELLEDCNYELLFPKYQGCKYFSECELGICKSNCESEFLGQCNSGFIDDSEYGQWCEVACCRYSGFTENYCQIEEKKWDCKILAENSGANEFAYEDKSLAACESGCLNRIDGATNGGFVDEENLLKSEVFRVYDYSLSLENEGILSSVDEEKEVSENVNSGDDGLDEGIEGGFGEEGNLDDESSKGWVQVVAYLLLILGIAILVFLLFRNWKIAKEEKKSVVKQNNSFRKNVRPKTFVDFFKKQESQRSHIGKQVGKQVGKHIGKSIGKEFEGSSFGKNDVMSKIRSLAGGKKDIEKKRISKKKGGKREFDEIGISHNKLRKGHKHFEKREKWHLNKRKELFAQEFKGLAKNEKSFSEYKKGKKGLEKINVFQDLKDIFKKSKGSGVFRNKRKVKEEKGKFVNSKSKKDLFERLRNIGTK